MARDVGHVQCSRDLDRDDHRKAVCLARLHASADTADLPFPVDDDRISRLSATPDRVVGGMLAGSASADRSRRVRCGWCPLMAVPADCLRRAVVSPHGGRGARRASWGGAAGASHGSARAGCRWRHHAPAAMTGTSVRRGDVASHAVRATAGGSSSITKLALDEALEFTRRVFTETVRMRPPVWILTRTTSTDTELGGHPIAANTTVVYSPYLIHHRADLYDDPDRFDPDRWIDPKSAARRDAFVGSAPERGSASATSSPRRRRSWPSIRAGKKAAPLVRR